MNRLTLAIAGTLVFMAACTKSAKKTTSCTPTFHGYRSHWYTGALDFDSSVAYGTINPSTITSTSMGTFTTRVYASQGAFNSSDNCFYSFRTRQGGSAGYGTLYKVSLSGTVTTLSGPSTATWALTYNKVTNKLYCLTYAGALAEVIVSGSSYSLTPVVTPVHPVFSCYNGANTTVDDNTGAIYLTTGDTTMIYVEKYVPGAGSTSVVASCTGAWDVLGLRYNKSDNMLYAVKEIYPYSGTAPFDFIKIDPASGTVATLSALSFDVNYEFYSACIDPCNNKYLISTTYTGMSFSNDTFVVNQLDMSGTLIQHDITVGYLNNLYVDY